MSALSYNECEIERHKLAAARQSFEDLHAMISGRSGEYHTITDPVGFEFSDLIGDSLRSAATENKSAWSSAMMACTHAFGVLNMVSDAVKTYEDKIADIKARLDEKLTALDDPDDITAVNNTVEPFNEEARQAWTKLENECDTAQDTLREGPTAGNIRMLAEAGHLGDTGLIGFYTTENLDYFAVDPDQAELIATHIEYAVEEGRGGSIEILEESPEYLALVANVVSRALTARKNGEQLSDGEVKFLDTLFSELGGSGTKEEGFLDFVDRLNSSENIDDSLREDITSGLSDAMLVLSDESIGGGIDRLPGDVKGAANGPELPTVYNDDFETDDYMEAYETWGNKFSTLGGFLKTSEVRGGTDFSATLLATSASNVEFVDFYNEGPGFDDYQNVIGVASRNEEANHILLTGNDFDGNKYSHHENNKGLTPETAVAALYSQDWEDDGKAVSGITDWIADTDSDSTGVTDENRGTALAGLITLFESKDFQDSVLETRHTVTDSEGEEWLNASASQVNPEIAQSLGEVFLTYMDEFADTDGPDGSSIDTRWHPEKGNVELSTEGRLAYTQFIVGDEQTAQNIFTESAMNTAYAMEDYATNTGERTQGPATAAGSLQGLVEAALDLESQRREDNHNNEADYRNKIKDAAIDTLGGVAGDAKAPGFTVEVAKFLLKEGFETDTNEANPHAGEDGGGEIGPQMKGLAISAAAEGDPAYMAELDELGIAKRDGNGDLYVPIDHTEWGENGDFDDSLSELNTRYDKIDEEKQWPDGEGATWNAVYNFRDNYNEAKGMWGES